jgi:hypothetical protein
MYKKVHKSIVLRGSMVLLWYSYGDFMKISWGFHEDFMGIS